MQARPSVKAVEEHLRQEMQQEIIAALQEQICAKTAIATISGRKMPLVIKKKEGLN